MKSFFLSLLLLPLCALAQDCQLKKYKDQFSQESKLSTGFLRFSSSTLSMDADAKEIDFLFSLPNNGGEAKCFDDASTISFVFEGGKIKANFKNTGTMNCEGLVHVTFKNAVNTPSPLQRLIDKKISTISITGNNKSVTVITLSTEQQQLFTDKLSCLVKDAKTLIK